MSAGFCKKKFSTNKISSFYFMAPERILAELEKSTDQSLWTKCDIWSVGCILFFLTFGKVPFVGENNHYIVKNIKKGLSIAGLNQNWDDEIWSLLKLIEAML
jgi:serine/threonine protein kinase